MKKIKVILLCLILSLSACAEEKSIDQTPNIEIKPNIQQTDSFQVQQSPTTTPFVENSISPQPKSEIKMDNIKVDKKIDRALLKVVLKHLKGIKDDNKIEVMETLYPKLTDTSNALWIWETRNRVKEFSEVELDTERNFDFVKEYSLKNASKSAIVKVNLINPENSSGTMNFIFVYTDAGWKLFRID